MVGNGFTLVSDRNVGSFIHNTIYSSNFYFKVQVRIPYIRQTVISDMVRYCLYVDHPLANKPDHSNAIIVTSLSFTTLNVSEILVLVIVLYLAGL
jgi:myosin-crossreactive antigen